MKKIFTRNTIILGMLLLSTTSFAGCSKSEENSKDDNAIELTMENYEDYLTVNVTTGTTGDGYKVHGISDPFYKEIQNNITVEGVSDNYNYEDVKVEAEITVKYTPYSWSGLDQDDVLFTETLSTTCNVAGDGSDSTLTNVQDGYTTNLFMAYDYEVTKVSGSVVPAK